MVRWPRSSRRDHAADRRRKFRLLLGLRWRPDDDAEVRTRLSPARPPPPASSRIGCCRRDEDTRGWDCARSMVSGGRPRRVKGGMRSRGGGGGVGDAAMGSADVGGGQSPIDDKVE